MLSFFLAFATAQIPSEQPFSVDGPIFHSPALGVAFFEFAPSSGSGMGAACACATSKGAKGETLTFTRASSATCLKGPETSGIADGDLVTCASNEPRVMRCGDGDGPLGLFVEQDGVNTCLRGRELCNAAWLDVGTPSCSSDQATGPYGAATMEQFTDNNGAAFEGRSQAIVTTSQTLHSVSCFVKAGTAAAASITLVGTGNSAGDCTGNVTGLSASTSYRLSCSSPAAYGAGITAVTVAIRVGSVVGDQGTLFVEGCQHEVNAPAPTSYIDTAGTSEARAIETPTFTVNWQSASSFSSSHVVVTRRPVADNWRGFSLYFDATHFALNFVQSDSKLASFFQPSADLVASTSTVTLGVPNSLRSFYDGTNIGSCVGGSCITAVEAQTLSTGSTTLYIGRHTDAVTLANGCVKQFCLDPSSGRCL